MDSKTYPVTHTDAEWRALLTPEQFAIMREHATERAGRVLLRVQDRDGCEETLERDHLILATGYRPDVAKLPFLSADILANLKTSGKTPVLSANFESSVGGLHFVGYASVASFGPVMRFMAGAPHPARRLARHLATQPHPRFAAVPTRVAG